MLGYLLYKRAVTINLAKFFTWTGAGLIIVAGGVLAYGVHDLQEAGDLPGLNNLAFDVSGAVPPDSWYGTLLKGTFNFSPQTTWLQAVVWLLYVVPVMYLFFRPARKPRRQRPGVASRPRPSRRRPSRRPPGPPDPHRPAREAPSELPHALVRPATPTSARRAAAARGRADRLRR